jgi:hypothetical protein
MAVRCRAGGGRRAGSKIRVIPMFFATQQSYPSGPEIINRSQADFAIIVHN